MCESIIRAPFFHILGKTANLHAFTLSQGRHPLAITDPNVMMFLAEKNGIHNVEPVQVFMKKELVMAFRNGEDNKARMQLLEKILKNQQASP